MPIKLISHKDVQVLSLVNEKNIDLLDLMHLLNGTGVAITQAQVQEYLNKASQDQLAQMFYISGLIKLVEIAHQKQKEQQNKTSSHEPVSKQQQQLNPS